MTALTQARTIAPTNPWPWFVLPMRTLLFAAFQALIALIFALGGRAAAWEASIGWWPLVATLANLATIAVLAVLMRREGRSLRQLYVPERGPFLRDLLTSLGALLLAAPLVVVPNLLLGNLLFGDVNATVDIMFRPLPVWAAYTALLLFPLTIAFAELPAYFGYAMPRIASAARPSWIGVLLPVIWLSLQHATLPLVFDWRFIVWRALMFLGLALLLGVVLRWRPRLLPYLMTMHALLDFQAALMFVSLSV